MILSQHKLMHIFIIPIGFILWYIAYETKPVKNDEVGTIWEQEKIVKRNKLISIIKERFN